MELTNLSFKHCDEWYEGPCFCKFKHGAGFVASAWYVAADGKKYEVGCTFEKPNCWFSAHEVPKKTDDADQMTQKQAEASPHAEAFHALLAWAQKKDDEAVKAAKAK